MHKNVYKWAKVKLAIKGTAKRAELKIHVYFIQKDPV